MCEVIPQGDAWRSGFELHAIRLRRSHRVRCHGSRAILQRNSIPCVTPDGVFWLSLTHLPTGSPVGYVLSPLRDSRKRKAIRERLAVASGLARRPPLVTLRSRSGQASQEILAAACLPLLVLVGVLD